MVKTKIIAAIILLATINVFAQAEQEQRMHSVKINFLPQLIDNNTNESYFLVNLSFKVSYEKFVNKNFTPYFQIGFQGPLTFDIETAEAGEAINTAGLNLGIGNKFYFLTTEKSPKGFYAMPEFIYNNIKLFEEEDNEGNADGFIRISDFGISAILGYQCISKKGFTVDCFTGAGIFRRNYYDNTFLESATVVDRNETGLRPHLGVQVGYSF